MQNSDPADDRQGCLVIERQGGEAACLMAHQFNALGCGDTYWDSMPWPDPIAHGAPPATVSAGGLAGTDELTS